MQVVLPISTSSMYFRPFTIWTRALLMWDSLNKKMSFVQLLNFSTLCLAALRTPGSLVLIVLGNPGFADEFKIWEQKSAEGLSMMLKTRP